MVHALQTVIDNPDSAEPHENPNIGNVWEKIRDLARVQEKLRKASNKGAAGSAGGDRADGDSSSERGKSLAQLLILPVGASSDRPTALSEGQFAALIGIARGSLAPSVYVSMQLTQPASVVRSHALELELNTYLLPPQEFMSQATNRVMHYILDDKNLTVLTDFQNVLESPSSELLATISTGGVSTDDLDRAWTLIGKKETCFRLLSSLCLVKYACLPDHKQDACHALKPFKRHAKVARRVADDCPWLLGLMCRSHFKLTKVVRWISLLQNIALYDLEPPPAILEVHYVRPVPFGLVC